MCRHVTEYSVAYYVGAFGSTVGWGTVLQPRRMRVRFLMVSLEVFVGIVADHFLYSCLLGLLASVMDGSWPYIISIICQCMFSYH
jgi:hypothetical protein